MALTIIDPHSFSLTPTSSSLTFFAFFFFAEVAIMKETVRPGNLGREEYIWKKVSKGQTPFTTNTFKYVFVSHGTAGYKLEYHHVDGVATRGGC